MFRLRDKTTFCIFSNTSLPLGTPTRLRIVLSSSLLYPPNTSITMLNCFTWYPGNCLFNSSPSGAYFSVFSTALGIFVVQPRIAHLQQGDRFCCAVHYPGVNSVGSYRHMPHGLHIQGHPRTLALGHYVLVNSSREHPPRANPGHLLHDESRGPGIWQFIVSRSPGHLQTTKIWLSTIQSPFPKAFRVKGFKQSSTVILE